MHWLMVPLFTWFIVVQPIDVQRIGPGAVQFHSVMGLLFVSLALVWTVDYMRKGSGQPAWPETARQGAAAASDCSTRC
jgi:cytochrome b561